MKDAIASSCPSPQNSSKPTEYLAASLSIVTTHRHEVALIIRLHADQTTLPLAPERRRQSWLYRGHFIGPNDYLLAILPLDRDCPMGGLEPTRVDGEIA